ncbi:MAG: hypothetical protein NTX48_07870 [Planctomycetales bacterium]|nr:hypothetical protein [Planctomycetales bacterium]
MRLTELRNIMQRQIRDPLVELHRVCKLMSAFTGKSDHYRRSTVRAAGSCSGYITVVAVTMNASVIHLGRYITQVNP